MLHVFNVLADNIWIKIISLSENVGNKRKIRQLQTRYWHNLDERLFLFPHLSCPPTEWRQAGPPAGSRVQASAQDPSPGHPPAEGHQRLLRPQQGEPPVSNTAHQFRGFIIDMWYKNNTNKIYYKNNSAYFLIIKAENVIFKYLSVPIIATAVQEELETGSASSGDAACATNTVKPPDVLTLGEQHQGKHLLRHTARTC